MAGFDKPVSGHLVRKVPVLATRTRQKVHDKSAFPALWTPNASTDFGLCFAWYSSTVVFATQMHIELH